MEIDFRGKRKGQKAMIDRNLHPIPLLPLQHHQQSFIVGAHCAVCSTLVLPQLQKKLKI